jgi:hypothetical protein
MSPCRWLGALERTDDLSILLSKFALQNIERRGLPTGLGRLIAKKAVKVDKVVTVLGATSRSRPNIAGQKIAMIDCRHLRPISLVVWCYRQSMCRRR